MKRFTIDRFAIEALRVVGWELRDEERGIVARRKVAVRG